MKEKSKPLHKQIIEECATGQKKWRHFAVSASAGTGKTYTIEHLVLELLCLEPEMLPGIREQRLNLDEVLVVTFTEKATGELKMRIREKIAEHIVELQKESQEQNDPLIQHLESNINAFDEASIFTIHGFCNKYLQSNPFESKSPLKQEIASSSDVSELVIRNFLRRTDLSEDLTQIIQEFFAEYGEASLGILEDIAKKTSSNDAVIFGEQPWGSPLYTPAEIKQQFVQMYENLDPKIDNWMRQCLKDGKKLQPSRPALSENLQTLFTDITQADATNPEQLLNDLHYLTEYKNNEVTFSTSRIDGTDLSPLNHLLEKVRYYPKSKKSTKFASLFYKLRKAYQDHLQEKGLITFDSMISNLAAELQKPDSTLLPAMQEQFAFGIIDEFQDTSADQWSIFRSIFYAKNENAMERVLFLIGDPKQSIYRFQGADVNTCNEAMNLVSNNDSQKIATLNTNYRSDAQLIEDYNAIFSAGDWFEEKYENVKVGIKDGEKDKKPELDFLFKKEATRTFVWNLPEKHRVKTNKPAQTQTLNHWIADTIAHLVKKGVAPERIAILCRKNSEFPPLLRLLRKHGVPANLGGESGLFTSLEALEVLHLFQALLNPKDPSALMRCALGMFFDKKVEDLHCDDERGTHLSKVQQQLAKWLPLLEHRQYEILFDRIGQDTQISKRQLEQPGGARAFTATQQLFAYALKLLRQENFGWRELCLRMQSLYDEEIKETDAENTFYRATGQGAVELLTMHKSKGLEFDVVFFATGFGGANTKITSYNVYHKPDKTMKLAIKPWDENVKKEADKQEKEEDQRLWYVALTRAKYAQFIPYWHITTKGSTSAHFINPALDDAKKKYPQSFPFITDKDIADITVEINIPDSEKEELTSSQNHAKYDAEISSAEIKAAQIPHRTRLQTSYSALARHSSHGSVSLRSDGGRIFTDDEVPLADAFLLESAEENRKLLPPGAHTGTALHSIFENIDYDLVQKSASPDALLENPEVQELITSSLNAQNVVRDSELLPASVQLCAQIVWHTLRAQIPNPLGGSDFDLLSIPAADRLDEMEYHLRLDDPVSANMAGNLFGFMDLVFKYENHYFVLDWKSNFLSVYGPDLLQKSMETSQYTLQAAIYNHALEQFVKQFDPDALVGGAIYLFLRGTQAQSSQGVWTASSAELKQHWQKAQAQIHSLILRDNNE